MEVRVGSGMGWRAGEGCGGRERGQERRREKGRGRRERGRAGTEGGREGRRGVGGEGGVERGGMEEAGDNEGW